MRIPEVFSLIFNYEKNPNEKEHKYIVMRKILDENLAEKDDFATIVENHDSIIKNLMPLLDKDYDTIEERLVDIYNYPEIMSEYASLCEEYKYDTISDDDSEYDDSEEEDINDVPELIDTSSDSEEDTNDVPELIDTSSDEMEEDDKKCKPNAYDYALIKCSRLESLVKANIMLTMISIGLSVFNFSYNFKL